MSTRTSRFARREVIAPAPGDDGPSPPLARLHAELTFYDRSATNKKRGHFTIRLLELLVGAGVPAAAVLGATPALLGVLGAVVVVLQGAEQLFHFHAQWLSHRSTFETLKREEALYLAKAGPYRTSDDLDVTLAERVDEIRTAETLQFVETVRTRQAVITRGSERAEDQPQEERA